MSLSSPAARIAASLDQFVAIRHDLHRHPELALEEHRTAGIVADLLIEWGYEATQGVGGAGVVATLTRGNGPRRIGIRADMDALPIHEITGLPYASTTPGKMHACGHDGHTTILLCAAKYLAEHGQFNGTVVLIFQPAEEVAAGASAMLADGLFDRFPVDAIYGMHNYPGLAIGNFEFIDGPAMASSDTGIVVFRGKGGHGAQPHLAVDPIVTAASFIMALQTLVSRNIDPKETAVASVGAVHAGSAGSIIPDEVELKFTLRAFRPDVRAKLKERIVALARAQADSYGATAEVTFKLTCAPVVTTHSETELARQVANETFGASVVEDGKPTTGGDDFAFYLEHRPGTYLHIGNGDTLGLHNAGYDFNDACIAPAALYWVRLAETYLTGEAEG